MKALVTSFIKNIKVFLRLFEMSFQTLLEYRIASIATFVSINMWLVAEVIWILIAFRFIDTFAGFTFWQYMTFHGFCFFIINIFYFLFDDGLFQLPNKIYDGTIDFWVLKPVKTEIFACFGTLSFSSLISAIFGLGISVFSLIMTDNTIEIEKLFIIGFLIVLGIYSFYKFILMIYSSTFWTGRITALIILVEKSLLEELSSTPTNIFTGVFKFVLYFVIPNALIITVPIQILFDKINFNIILYYLFYAVILTIISDFIWKQGMKKYSSVSS